MGVFSRPFNPREDLQALFGKVALVTGAHKGIGFWTAAYLSRRGAKVYICAPTIAKADMAIQRMKDYSPAATLLGTLIPVELDMTNPRTTKETMKKHAQKLPRLDMLVITEHGDEAMIGEEIIVDYFTPFVIVKALSPLLERTSKEALSDVRVVVVTSSKHEAIADVSFNTPNALQMEWRGYSMSKLANILLVKELQRRYDAQGIPITCTAVNPGIVYPEAVPENLRKLPYSWIFLYISSFLAYLPEQGAYTTLYAAASPDVADSPYQYRGGYMVPGGKVVNPSLLARNGDVAEELWIATEKTLKNTYCVEF